MKIKLFLNFPSMKLQDQATITQTPLKIKFQPLNDKLKNTKPPISILIDSLTESNLNAQINTITKTSLFFTLSTPKTIQNSLKATTVNSNPKPEPQNPKTPNQKSVLAHMKSPLNSQTSDLYSDKPLILNPPKKSYPGQVNTQ